MPDHRISRPALRPRPAASLPGVADTTSVPPVHAGSVAQPVTPLPSSGSRPAGDAARAQPGSWTSPLRGTPADLPQAAALIPVTGDADRRVPLRPGATAPPPGPGPAATASSHHGPPPAGPGIPATPPPGPGPADTASPHHSPPRTGPAIPATPPPGPGPAGTARPHHGPPPTGPGIPATPPPGPGPTATARPSPQHGPPRTGPGIPATGDATAPPPGPGPAATARPQHGPPRTGPGIPATGDATAPPPGPGPAATASPHHSPPPTGPGIPATPPPGPGPAATARPHHGPPPTGPGIPATPPPGPARAGAARPHHGPPPAGPGIPATPPPGPAPAGTARPHHSPPPAGPGIPATPGGAATPGDATTPGGPTTPGSRNGAGQERSGEPAVVRDLVPPSGPAPRPIAVPGPEPGEPYQTARRWAAPRIDRHDRRHRPPAGSARSPGSRDPASGAGGARLDPPSFPARRDRGRRPAAGRAPPLVRDRTGLTEAHDDARPVRGDRLPDRAREEPVDDGADLDRGRRQPGGPDVHAEFHRAGAGRDAPGGGPAAEHVPLPRRVGQRPGDPVLAAADG